MKHSVRGGSVQWIVGTGFPRPKLKGINHNVYHTRLRHRGQTCCQGL